MNLIAELEASDRKFHRPACPSVFNEYVAFMATGKYPYIDEVVTRIALAYRVAESSWGPNQKFHHQAVADLGEPLLRQLHHEVYLASGEWRVAEMFAQEMSLALDGYRPIIDLVPAIGARIEIAGQRGPLRLASAPRDDWAMLEPRKRTNGWSLNGAMQKHRAYLSALADGSPSMNGPAVIMYREVAS